MISREFALAAVIAACSCLPASSISERAPGQAGRKAPPDRIDRRALVERHNPVLRRFDIESPLSVGNGEFAFTADATGLQTFAEAYDQTIPLGTLSQWGWHTAPNPNGWSIDKFRFAEFDSHGRKVGYADIPGSKRTPEIEWLRANPHRLHLGRIGFRIALGDGRPAALSDLTDIEQVLDLWNGLLRSRFRVEGSLVEVSTICHPTDDQLAVKVTSPLLGSGRLSVEIRFPYGTGQMTAADWGHPDAHETLLELEGSAGARFTRRLDGDGYRVALRWNTPAKLEQAAKHHFRLEPAAGSGLLQLSCQFSQGLAPARKDDFPGIRAAARARWAQPAGRVTPARAGPR